MVRFVKSVSGHSARQVPATAAEAADGTGASNSAAHKLAVKTALTIKSARLILRKSAHADR
jgi:hypothetical protein